MERRNSSRKEGFSLFSTVEELLPAPNEFSFFCFDLQDFEVFHCSISGDREPATELRTNTQSRKLM
jgi:hypothetical protein